MAAIAISSRPVLAHEPVSASNGMVVAQHPLAAEAGIETLPAYRRRGLGAQAVVKWASLVRESGRTPLYSTSWENTASQGLAKNLRLVQYGTDLHLSERQPGS